MQERHQETKGPALAYLERGEKMDKYYRLDGHEVVKCNNLEEWAKWFKTADRHVARDTHGKVTVSTIFLGLDHNFGDGKPVLFETLVLGGDINSEMDRYRTW